MSNATVRLDNISKQYGSVVAVDDVNLTIEPGEFVTLLGPSGCGKSTTLRVLGGFVQPTSGRVFLGDEDVTKVPPNRRDVNMVFQDYALFPHMTSGQNIAFGLELKGNTKNETEKRVEELLEFMRLEGFKGRKPDELSGGQRQRVALARALAPDPKVLLLDEPLGALDAKLRKQVQVELKSIQRSTGKTFIFVTHDQEEALTMSDRVLVMNKGRLEQDGSPKDLYYHPESQLVADFVGETNMLSCLVKGMDQGLVVLDWHGHELRGECRTGKPDTGQTIMAAIRPEKIKCFARKPKAAQSIETRVVQQVFRGNFTTANLEVDGDQGLSLQATLDGNTADAITDDKLWVELEPAHLSVLLR